MKVIVIKKDSTDQALRQQETAAGKLKSVHDDRRQVPTQWLNRAGDAPQAVRIIRDRVAVLLAVGLICCAPAGMAQAPSFTTQPASQVVGAGNNATFTAAATGGPSYQWFFAFNGVTNLIATGSSFIVTGAYANEGDYFCVASNSLFLAISRISTPSFGSAVASERTRMVTPASPDRAVRPRSDTTNHWVARSP